MRTEGLEEKVAILGDVDVPTFLSSLDIFVFPVQSALGMIDPPLTVIEAMASQCSIVTFQVSGISDILADRVNARLVSYEERDSPLRYAECIHELVSDGVLRRRLAVRARQDASRYNVAHMADKFLAVYADAVFGKRSSYGG